MYKLTFSLLLLISFQLADAQRLGFHAFVRTPQTVNFRLSKPEAKYNQGLSIGLGLTHQTQFLEFGTFIFEGDSYGYYSFFGSALKSSALGKTVNLNTNWFGEVSYLPFQGEDKQATWIYTAGMCLLPNVQLNQWNVGIPMCFGLAYQEKECYLNSRIMLNLSYRLSR